MVAFKDLRTDAGLKELNTHLATRSYIDGFQPSQSDVALLNQISASVDAQKYPHASRWLSHIQSFTPTVRSKWAGQAKAAAAPTAAADDSDSDDDFMASLSDDEDDDDNSAQELINRKNAEREAAKRATKKGPVAKSTLILDVKPEDSETNLDELAEQIKSIEQEGLLWGNYEKVPVAYGVNKIRIAAVVVDDLVSTDSLQEAIEEMEGCQSTDIVAFNKL